MLWKYSQSLYQCLSLIHFISLSAASISTNDIDSSALASKERQEKNYQGPSEIFTVRTKLFLVIDDGHELGSNSHYSNWIITLILE